jgi:hypothetical protein
MSLHALEEQARSRRSGQIGTTDAEAKAEGEVSVCIGQKGQKGLPVQEQYLLSSPDWLSLDTVERRFCSIYLYLSHQTA